MGGTNMGVRWDAVVKNSLRSSTRVPEKEAADLTQAAQPEVPVEIEVWLFGMMAGPGVTNPLRFQLASRCSLRDVLDELGRRLGSEFLRTIASESGELFNTCRVFLDGEPVKDVATRICVTRAKATVEMILFREIEGG